MKRSDDKMEKKLIQYNKIRNIIKVLLVVFFVLFTYSLVCLEITVTNPITIPLLGEPYVLLWQLCVFPG